MKLNPEITNMKIEATSTDEYLSKLPEDRRRAVEKLRLVLRNNLPEGFEETINYNMIGFVVPHSIYPPGYHCDTSLPLPFINVASQKKLCGIVSHGYLCQ